MAVWVDEAPERSAHGHACPLNSCERNMTGIVGRRTVENGEGSGRWCGAHSACPHQGARNCLCFAQRAELQCGHLHEYNRSPSIEKYRSRNLGEVVRFRPMPGWLQIKWASKLRNRMTSSILTPSWYFSYPAASTLEATDPMESLLGI